MKKKFTLLTVGILCCASLATGAVAANLVEKITAELRPDFTIEVDDKVKEFKNVNGETVYPILYEGTTYLPLRAIGELMGKTVYWYEDDKLIELKDDPGVTVTDADVIVNGSKEDDKNSNPDKYDKDYKGEKPDKSANVEHYKDVDTSDFIGEDAAFKIALEKAGLSASELTYRKVKLDYDDGVWHYDVDFKQGKVEYDVEISADKGEIISFEKDLDD